MQWWIDTAGKLGPLFVAVAVFLANRSQTSWSNAVSRRAAGVEDQKLRLNLLDRRIVAVRAVEAAIREFNLPGEVTPAMVEHLHTALNVAEMVFDKEQEVEVTRSLNEVWRWQYFNREVQRQEKNGNEEKRLAAIDALFREAETMMERLPRLLDALKESTRVTVLSPLEPTLPWLTRALASARKHLTR